MSLTTVTRRVENSDCAIGEQGLLSAEQDRSAGQRSLSLHLIRMPAPTDRRGSKGLSSTGSDRSRRTECGCQDPGWCHTRLIYMAEGESQGSLEGLWSSTGCGPRCTTESSQLKSRRRAGGSSPPVSGRSRPADSGPG